MNDEHRAVLALLYSGQLANIELALLSAKTLAFDLSPYVQPLVQLYTYCNFAQTKVSTTEALHAVLSRTKLHISYLHELPAGLWQLPRLEELTIEHFTMRRLPSELGNLRTLKILRIQWGQFLTTLPATIGELSNLEELHLDSNALEDIPAEIGNLYQLRTLSLRANALMSLPVELAQLTRLEHLYLAQNNLHRQLIPTRLTNRTKTNPTIVKALRRVFKW